MFFQLISLLFSLLYYAVILAVIVVVVFYLYFVVYLLRANDFPNKRRMCTSKQKLTGKTAIVTGMDTISVILLHDTLNVNKRRNVQPLFHSLHTVDNNYHT